MSDIDAHQLLCSSVLHKPGTMAWTAWTADGYPWKQPFFCFHPSCLQETDKTVDVFHTHTRGSFHHKTQWRLHQDWPDLQSTSIHGHKGHKSNFKKNYAMVYLFNEGIHFQIWSVDSNVGKKLKRPNLFITSRGRSSAASLLNSNKIN